MAKHFSKKYGKRDELSTTCNLKVISRCLSAPDLLVGGAVRANRLIFFTSNVNEKK